jgi:coatomer protein complex subunit epsilon
MRMLNLMLISLVWWLIWHSVALIVQMHLQQNRTDLAAKEATNARKWAQDSLLVNIVESWVGMREVYLSSEPHVGYANLYQGGEKYQAAYYVFEELAQAAATQSVQSLVGQAVAEIHLGRLPEAEAAFQQALELDPKNADVLSNMVVLNTILGKDVTGTKADLQKVKPSHQLLVDFAEKKTEFERACEKYSPKFEV